MHGLRAIHNLLFASERSEPTNHFTDENTYAPHISLVVVALPSHHFRCDISRSATVSKGSIFLHISQLLGKTEVYQLYVPLRI